MLYRCVAVAALYLASETSAFSISPAAVAKPAAVRSSDLFMQMTAPAGWQQINEELWEGKDADIRIEGGSTLKTFKMPPDVERVQYMIKSPSGRPIKAKVELWIGPIRCVHEMVYDCMDGGEFPIKTTLQFKKLAPVLKVSTDSTFEFPLECGVFVPSKEESKLLGDVTTDFFYGAPMKDRVQGGSTIDNKGGAIRTFRIDPAWEKTQLMIWSKDVGKKSFKSDIEILQGPNNPKQLIKLRCGGSTQPYHCVLDTPGLRLDDPLQLEEVPRGRPLRDCGRPLRADP